MKTAFGFVTKDIKLPKFTGFRIRKLYQRMRIGV